MARKNEVPADSVQVNTWIDAELLAELDRFAELHDRSRAHVINQGLERWIRQIKRARDTRAKSVRSR